MLGCVPHAHHFLERLDRVVRSQTEFLLGLYRDHEAVKYILDHVNLPEGAQRVALAADDPREGPFAIVTRDGHFVTCLGVAKVGEKRERRELAMRELRPDEEEDDLLQRAFTRGRRFAREDFQALSAFEALLGMTPFLIMIDLGCEAVAMRAALAHGADKVVVNGSTIKALEQQERAEWAVAHLMMLTCAAERQNLEGLLNASKQTKTSPSYLCSAQGGSTWFMRSVWAAARLGKGVLPAYKAGFGSATEWFQMVDAALALAALGIRHAGLMPEVKGVLNAQKPLAEARTDDMTQRGRAFAAHLALQSIDNPDSSIEKMTNIGRDMCVTLGSGLPEGHALRFDKPEDVPLGLVHTALLTLDGDMFDEKILTFAVHCVPLAARAAAEDFYFPREVVRAWVGQWTPDEQIDRLKRHADKQPKKEPVRAQNKVGRNDPCSCGSGKKWKKCHGSGR
jgi:hypothetical protein